MKLKKVLMILIALAVVLTMGGVVSATEYNTENGEMSDKNTIVKYELAQSYVVTIPSAVTILAVGTSSPGPVNVTNLLINPGNYLHINLTSRNATDIDGIYKLVLGESYIRYYINNTAATGESDSHVGVVNGADILTVAAGNKHPKLTNEHGTAKIGNYTTLFFNTTADFIKDATTSGTHSDTLTFQFRVDKTAPNN